MIVLRDVNNVDVDVDVDHVLERLQCVLPLNKTYTKTYTNA